MNQCSNTNENISENQIGLKSVKDLLGLHFYIPNYQRGYRWTKVQIEDLLDDLYALKDPHAKSSYYCMQPLVVQKVIQNSFSETLYEVIDGQQRLTTILLILKALREEGKNIDNPYSITYQRSNELSKFIDSLSLDDEHEKAAKSNIDNYHIYEAYKTINSWFDSTDTNNTNDKVDFLYNMLTNLESRFSVNFIWYETKENNPIEVFTRLNIGKISLTNAELIKALFLNPSNFAEYQNDQCGVAEKRNSHIALRQKEIASEWDSIEYQLQDDEFWLFLNQLNYNKPTRIDFIFELIENKQVKELCKGSSKRKTTKNSFKDDYHTFRHFYQLYKSTRSPNSKSSSEFIDRNWNEVKRYFHTFKEWYDDVCLYHYVGFLIAVGNKTVDKLFLKWEEVKSKSEFIAHLKYEICNELINATNGGKEGLINLDCQYDLGNKRKCIPVLLFHNIQTVINQNKNLKNNERYSLGTYYKFPFHLYKIEKWDVEHINPTTPNQITDKKAIREWLKNAQSDLSKGIKQQINDCLKAESMPLEKAKKLIEELIDGDQPEKKWDDNTKNQIKNYALLDSSTNSCYKNAIFAAKRRILIEKSTGSNNNRSSSSDKKNSKHKSNVAVSTFVPPCTMNAFLKYYSDAITDNNYWTLEDAKHYKIDIERCIQILKDPIS